MGVPVQYLRSFSSSNRHVYTSMTNVLHYSTWFIDIYNCQYALLDTESKSTGPTWTTTSTKATSPHTVSRLHLTHLMAYGQLAWNHLVVPEKDSHRRTIGLALGHPGLYSIHVSCQCRSIGSKLGCSSPDVLPKACSLGLEYVHLSLSRMRIANFLQDMNINGWQEYDPSTADGADILVGFIDGRLIGKDLKTKKFTVLKPNTHGNSYIWVYTGGSSCYRARDMSRVPSSLSLAARQMGVVDRRGAGALGRSLRSCRVWGHRLIADWYWND